MIFPDVPSNRGDRPVASLIAETLRESSVIAPVDRPADELWKDRFLRNVEIRIPGPRSCASRRCSPEEWTLLSTPEVLANRFPWQHRRGAVWAGRAKPGQSPDPPPASWSQISGGHAPTSAVRLDCWINNRLPVAPIGKLPPLPHQLSSAPAEQSREHAHRTARVRSAVPYEMHTCGRRSRISGRLSGSL
jgi:hypothetical protein